MDKKLSIYVKKQKALIDRALNQYLPPGRSAYLARVMRYSVFAGGKRFRPILMLAVAQALGKPANFILPAACAIELFHTFTLIHDDLPCMDDDDFRRGKLTAHKKFGEAAAVLAGDALQALSYEILLKETNGVPAPALGSAILCMLEAAGSNGVVAGQMLDLQSENRQIDLKTLKLIHAQKTGALIGAAVKIAAVLCGAHLDRIRRLEKYAEHLGLAFQIADDLLDCTSSFAKMGKKPGSDRRRCKSTYVSLLGIEKARQLLKQEHKKALSAVAGLGNKNFWLKALADFVVVREE
ncbi:MAG: polyprenyl synthetase family protein [Candidatus Margulisiibacteriota bacterium]